MMLAIRVLWNGFDSVRYHLQQMESEARDEEGNDTTSLERTVNTSEIIYHTFGALPFFLADSKSPHFAIDAADWLSKRRSWRRCLAWVREALL